MKNISIISITKKLREGYPGKIVYANITIDGKHMTDFEEINRLDYVSCLGWGTIEYQKSQIKRLLLQSESDFEDNRDSLYVCPCTDLGCGAVSMRIERQNDIVIWSDFGLQNNLESPSQLTRFNDIGAFYFKWSEYKEVIESTLLYGEPDYWHSSKWS